MSSTSISDAVSRIEAALWYGEVSNDILNVAVNVCLISSEYYVSDHEYGIVSEYINLYKEVSYA